MYAKIRSWHIVRFWLEAESEDDDDLPFIALCGRRGKSIGADDFEGEKSCETCLRIFAKESA